MYLFTTRVMRREDEIVLALFMFVRFTSSSCIFKRMFINMYYNYTVSTCTLSQYVVTKETSIATIHQEAVSLVELAHIQHHSLTQG